MENMSKFLYLLFNFFYIGFKFLWIDGNGKVSLEKCLLMSFKESINI